MGQGQVMEGGDSQREDERKGDMWPPWFTGHGDLGGRWLSSQLASARASAALARFVKRGEERGKASWGR